MSLILSKCIEYHDDRKICVASENGKTYTLNNNSNYSIKKIKIDKCILQKEGEQRCDYLMHAIKENDSKAMFIELKGGALLDGVKQVYDTIVYLRQDLVNCQLHARIVGKGDVPNITNAPSYKKLAKVILETKGTITRSTNKLLTETI